MKVEYDRYEIDDDIGRVDFERVHGWLSANYWSPGIVRWKVEQAAAHSAVVIGVYCGQVQVGYGRVVSDTTHFAYLADVHVDEPYRGHGIARAMVRFVQNHPLLKDAPHITLKTLDAHGVYAGVGFEPIADPQHWMRWTRRK
jgi:ribosomal protein S18 acetylase RimI-like enzyme